MAYQARQRDPIFDETTQALIERRGMELIGIILIGLGILAAMVVGSYAPEDPGWLSATDGAVQNWLGRIGAAVASPLVIIAGKGAWALALVLLVWGLRFVFHLGEERALNRLVFAPIAVAMCSIYASTLVPGEIWTHSFGLGGLFGDTVLGAILGMAPVPIAVGLKGLSVLSGAGAAAMLFYALGATWAEMRKGLRFLLVGIVMSYAALVSLAGFGARGAARGAVGAVHGARALQQRQADRRAEVEAAMGSGHRHSAYGEMEDEDDTAHFAPPPPLKTARVLRAQPELRTGQTPEPIIPATPAPRTGLFARMPSLMKRTLAPVPEPELVESPAFMGEIPEGLGGEDRIRVKIANALRAHQAKQHSHPQTPAREEPPLERPVRPQPMILNTALPPLRTSASQATPKSEPGYEPELIEGDDDLVDAAPLRHEPAPYAPLNRKVVQHKPQRKAQPSARAMAEAQPALNFDDDKPEYELPPLNLLTNPSKIERHHLSDEALEENARMLESVLDDYGVKGEIVSVRPGPVVTMYELEPAPGLKASRVIGLADDIARSMSALSARVSTVPGRSVIGIELPNANREKVVLREILSTRDFGDSNMRLPLALGKDIGGDAIVANLAKMPHLLIAGTTGSGKSVAINTMILSLLYRLTPEECRLIMIDPKMLELSVYDGIPHLLSPVVTDPKKAVVALKWVVAEMEERYRKMSKMGVRNIEGFNGRVREALDKDELFSRTVQTGFDDDTGEPIFETEEFQPEALPYIVVVVDEMADLMMVAGKEIEACIQRLAQMARASGIHLIMATQRPSVDVITGTIKANFPTRISFQVTSKIDSRTILGEQGAEQLLGMGDMLYMAGGARITRVHGPFVSDEEVEEIVTWLKSYGPPDYVGSVLEGPDDDKSADIDAVLGLGGNTTGEDALYDQAVAIVIKDRKCSTSYIQRKLAIGYNKAARLVEQMEEEGLVSASNHVGKREVLVPEQA
jgi:S-DNA-T family DNA segregation ATPase FtsK/SpoIIIE